MDSMKQPVHKPSKGYYIGLVIFIVIFVVYVVGFIYRTCTKTPYFMVMILPAHGGKAAVASAYDGDLYDSGYKKYMIDYKEGESGADFSEYDILLDLSRMIKKKLDHTKNMGQWKLFENILKQYGRNKRYRKIILDSDLLKKHSYKYYADKGEKDVNRHFRLFDYVSRSGLKKHKKGILSIISKYKPEIVLYLDFNHFNGNQVSFFSVPGFEFFNYIRSKLTNRNTDFNKYRSIINNWRGNNSLERKRNVIIDTWLYFTGTYPDSTYFSPSDKTIGYGFNAVSWGYKDTKYPKTLEDKKTHPQYYNNLREFQIAGDFWKREQYQLERYKRLDNGTGQGDVEYMGEEILKYIVSILAMKGEKYKLDIKKIYQYDPVSLYANSLVININLGSLHNIAIRKLYEKRKEEIADAICLGLYSICQGYDLRDVDTKKFSPEGKPVDFKKYYKYHYIGRKRKSYY